MNDTDDQWKRLVEATKAAPTEDSPAPSPIISVQNLRKTVHTLLLALTWRKWTLIAAALAGLAFLAFFVTFNDDSQPRNEGPIIQPEPPTSPTAP